MGHAPIVKVDVDLLGLLIQNLFENSVDAMRGQVHGKISIRVDTQDSVCELCFSDTGPGVKPEWREKMFQSGAEYQARQWVPAWARLGVMPRNPRLHHGSLDYQDCAGPGGASFVLHVPLVTPAESRELVRI